jgi:hypothetical protein
VPTLNQLRRETGSVEIPTDGDEPLVITYRKNFLSPTLATRLEKADALPPTQQIAVLADLVEHSVQGWNLTDDDGEPIAVSRSAIDALDAGVLQAIAVAIQEAIRPDPLSGTDSSATSSPADGSAASVPTGTPS